MLSARQPTGLCRPWSMRVVSPSELGLAGRRRRRNTSTSQARLRLVSLQCRRGSPGAESGSRVCSRGGGVWRGRSARSGHVPGLSGFLAGSAIAAAGPRTGDDDERMAVNAVAAGLFSGRPRGPAGLRPGRASWLAARSRASVAPAVNSHPGRAKVSNLPVSCTCREIDILPWLTGTPVLSCQHSGIVSGVVVSSVFPAAQLRSRAE